MTEIQTGDRIRSKSGRVESNGGISAVEVNEIVTARMVAGDLLTIEGRNGIYRITSFVKTSAPTLHEETPRNSSSAVTVQNTPSTSRKSVRKAFERRTGQALEWRDGHLCYAGTNARVPDSPHLPNNKPAWKPK